jgi:NitT/TauT family transport system substrate-binding protein
MSPDFEDGNKMTMLARTFGSIALLVASTHLAQAETPIRLVMDWAFEGAQSYWTIADQKSCFRDKGLSVKIDRGFGSGDAISKVASGAYDIGVSDFSSIVAYNAAHDENKLVATFVVSDRSPTSVVTLKKTGITTPKQLEGKRIADPQGEASRVLFPAFAAKNDIDQAKIEWISVAPNLRQATLVQGQADAVAGHVFTVITGLRALGIKDEDMTTLQYADYGVDLLGNSIMTKPAWAAAHKKEMQDFISCAIVGIKASQADPNAAVASLKKFNSVVDAATELSALDFSNKFAIRTPHVMKDGLSDIDPARLKTMLAQIAKAISIPVATPGDVWSDAYLPPKAERMLAP